MSILDQDLLDTFRVVAETRSFSQSAVILNVSQSSISSRIARFEEKAGKRLLARNTHAVNLTADGETMLIYAKKVLQLAEDAHRHLAAPAKEGKLRFGVSDGIETGALLDALKQLRQLHPNLHLEVHSGRNDVLLKRMDFEELDVVFGFQPAGHVEQDVLWSEPLAWVGDKSLVENEGLPIPLVSRPGPSLMRTFMIEALVRSRRRWVIKCEGDDFASVRAAVAAGIGITALPRSHARHEARICSKAKLPDLGAFEFFLRLKRDPDDQARDLAAILREMAPSVFGR